MKKGLIRLAKTLSPASKETGYRCSIQSLDTNSIYDAMANPSPYGWVNPDVGALVYFLDTPVQNKRIVGVLHDMNTTRSVDALAESEELDTSIESMAPGDVYMGKYGRITFPNDGSVIIENNSTGATGAGVSGATFTAISVDKDGNETHRVGYTGSAESVPTVSMDLTTDGVWKSYVGGTTFGDAYVALWMQKANKTAYLNSQGDIFVGATGAIGMVADTISMGATSSVTINAPELTITARVNSTGAFAIIGDTTITGNTTISATRALIDAGSILLGGSDALAIAIASKVVAALNGHAHSNGNNGAPTGPPLVPFTEAQIASVITKAK
jgi:hypothetical protein